VLILLALVVFAVGILRKVLKPALIATFVVVVGSGIMLVGYLFNLVI